MNLSYWEIKTWFHKVDFAIIGSGIVGISTALQLRKLHPKSKIVILEKGILPNGASTKNAGFACFGSLTEIIDDLKTHTEQEVINLVKKRWQGLQLLRNNLGDKHIGFKQFGGYEIFTSKKELEIAKQNCKTINNLIKPIFKQDVFTFTKNKFGFNLEQNTIAFNRFEAQINTGKMMQNLLKKAVKNNILIINNAEVTNLNNGNRVQVQLNNSFIFKVKKVFIATNGFAKQFLDDDIQPARAQVIITNKIKNLNIKGTFHIDKGYYYFRNINNRILIGGGRNLDFKTEETTEFGQTKLIQNKLEALLKQTILPNVDFTIAHRWSGIMGIGSQKKAIVKQIASNIYCGVRLGGMGVAIGSLIGFELAEKY